MVNVPLNHPNSLDSRLVAPRSRRVQAIKADQWGAGAELFGTKFANWLFV